MIIHCNNNNNDDDDDNDDDNDDGDDGYVDLADKLTMLENKRRHC